MQYYYAIFRQTRECIEVDFPDIEGCTTLGIDMEDAYIMAEEVLNEFTMAAARFIPRKLTYEEIKNQMDDEDIIIMMVPVRVTVWDEYNGEDGKVWS